MESVPAYVDDGCGVGRCPTDFILSELVVSACERVRFGSLVDARRILRASFYLFSKTICVGQTKTSNAR